jgi:aspartyl-tRNA(Asn)/glutamyl-tRNA(Gln) amidotransferase subunit A
VPVGLKDNLSLQGQPITCGSRILAGYRAPYTATALERLQAADAVFLGRCNMDEFAMGSSCENSAYQLTHNPWKLDRVPGGSSGGPAAAVAAGGVPLALGSDTGGSIRQPASLCGVVGLKPTYGRVSRYGLVAFASSTDQIGPLTRNVEDAALACSVLAGHDPRDSTSSAQPVGDYLGDLEAGLEGLKIGVLAEVGESELPAAGAQQWRASLRRLRQQGAELQEVSVANLAAAIDCYYVIATSEASANLARFDGVRYGHRAEAAGNLLELYMASRSEGFGEEVKRRIMLGTFALASGYYDAYYGQAQGVRQAMRQQFDRAFESVDLLVTPTSPVAAFPIGERSEDPLAMYLADIFTTPASLVGIPAISVPCGLDDEGLPHGLQIMGRAFDEATLLRAARAFEVASDWAVEPSFAKD